MKNKLAFKTKDSLRIRPLAILLIILLLAPGLYSGLKTVRYELKSEKVNARIRIALVTDLHSCKYGKKQQVLTKAINEESPDMILLGGDFFDDRLPADNCETFLKELKGKYPIYYVTGNHEYWASQKKFKECMQILKDYGAVRLAGETVTLRFQATDIALCGIDDPDGYLQNEENSFYNELESVTEKLPKDIYSILLSHRPEFYKAYQDRGFDLVLSGHAHGGQWRIPGLLDGVYAPNQGLFPKYAGGMHDELPTKMIVSRGLARESTRVPRIYNRPELVFIDIL
ncbi:MAG: metallophosphoesterase [Treponema sp.]|nr:metallophosphoesterase [Treponema sp.]